MFLQTQNAMKVIFIRTCCGEKEFTTLATVINTKASLFETKDQGRENIFLTL